MQKIEIEAANDIREYQESKKKQIRDAFRIEKADNTARLITKAELDENYPAETHERYSLQSLNKFREDISKAEGVEDKDGAFKAATRGLQSFVVAEGENKAIIFVRKKESEEE